MRSLPSELDCGLVDSNSNGTGLAQPLLLRRGIDGAAKEERQGCSTSVSGES